MPCRTFDPQEVETLVVAGQPTMLVGDGKGLNAIFDSGEGDLSVRILRGNQIGLLVSSVMAAGGLVVTASISGPLPCPPDPPGGGGGGGRSANERDIDVEVRAFRIMGQIRQEVGRNLVFGDPVPAPLAPLAPESAAEAKGK